MRFRIDIKAFQGALNWRRLVKGAFARFLMLKDEDPLCCSSQSPSAALLQVMCERSFIIQSQNALKNQTQWLRFPLNVFLCRLSWYFKRVNHSLDLLSHRVKASKKVCRTYIYVNLLNAAFLNILRDTSRYCALMRSAAGCNRARLSCILVLRYNPSDMRQTIGALINTRPQGLSLRSAHDTN